MQLPVSRESVNLLNGVFDPQEIEGSYYFVIENAPLRDGVTPLGELRKAID